MTGAVKGERVQRRGFRSGFAGGWRLGLDCASA